MNEVSIIGAGGVGRSLAMILNDYSNRGLETFDRLGITWWDPEPLEIENRWTQGFSYDACITMQDKVAALRDEFTHIKNADYKPEALNSDNLGQLRGTVIIACDNLETRKLLYDYCFTRNQYFIDIRVNGRQLAVYTKDMGESEAMKLFENISSDDSTPTSCLYQHEKDNYILHATPMIAAGIGIQFMVNNFRGLTNEYLELSL